MGKLKKSIVFTMMLLVCNVIAGTMYFDKDQNSYVDLTTMVTIPETGDFTIECWLKSQGGGSWFQILANKGHNACEVFYGGYGNGGKVAVKLEGGGETGFASKQTDGQWFHLALVKHYNATDSQSYMNCYINGALDNGAATVVDGKGVAISGVLNLQRISDPGATYYGALKEFRIWNKALDTTQLGMVKDNKVKESAGNVQTDEATPQIIAGLAWNNLILHPDVPSSLNLTTVSDKSSSSNNGTPSNVSALEVDFEAGNCLHFTGTNPNRYVKFASPVTISGDWSVSCWINRPGGDYGMSFLTSNADGEGDGLLIRRNQSNMGQTTMGFGPLSGETSTDFGHVLTTGKWVFLTVCRDAVNNRVYIYENGVEKVNYDASGDSNVTDLTVDGIGAYGPNPYNSFVGKLDELALWSKVLSVQNIKALMFSNESNPSETADLVAYYNFDNGSTSVASDVLTAQKGPNGTIKLRDAAYDSQQSGIYYAASGATVINNYSGTVYQDDQGGSLTSANGLSVTPGTALLAGETEMQGAIAMSMETVDWNSGKRFERIWLLSEEVSGKSGAFTFDADDIDGGRVLSDPSSYKLLYSETASGPFEVLNTIDPTVSTADNQVIFGDIALVGGYYTLGNTGSTLTPAFGINITTQSDGDNLVISWTAENLDKVTSFVIEQIEDGQWIQSAIVSVDDFQEQGVYSVDLISPLDTEYRLVILDTYGNRQNFDVASQQSTIHYSLNQGWNLLSVSVDDADLSALQAVVEGPIWSWDALSQNYKLVEAPDVGEGCWVYCTQDAEFSITGRATKVETKELLTGWNLIGVVEDMKTPEGVTVFGYEKSYNQIKLESVGLLRGKGYWILSDEAGELKVAK